MLSDLRQSLRSLSRARGFTLTVVCTLALGIGAAAAIYSLSYWILFRSALFPNEQHLYVIGSTSEIVRMNGVAATPFIYGAQLQACEAQTAVFSGFAATEFHSTNVVVDGEPIQASVRQASVGFFSTLGIKPVLGRPLLPADFRSGGRDVVVISHRFWMQQFGGSPEVLGRKLQVGDRLCRVVGVLGGRQIFPIFANADIYQPLELRVDPATPWSDILFVIGRLRPGVTPAQASAILQSVKPAVEPAFQQDFDRMRLALIRLHDLNRYFRPEIYWTLLGAVGFLFAIACLNAANLMLVRMLGRRRELSIRLALGGGRWRVVRLVLVESLWLSLLAAALGALVTHWLFPVMLRLASSSPGTASTFTLHGRVLAVIVGLAVLSSVVIVVVPALHLTGKLPGDGLRDGGVALGERPQLARLRSALVVLQAAFAVILLIGAGLMVRTLQRLDRVDFGFNPAGKVEVGIFVPKDHLAKPEERLRLFARLERRLRAIPGVRSVAFGSNALFPGTPFLSTKLKLADGGELGVAEDAVSPDFFKAAGLTLLRGRRLPANREDGNPVVVNEALARKYFGRHDPIGRMIDVLFGSKVQSWQVVGVVSDARQALRSVPAPHVYRPDWQEPYSLSIVFLRMDRDPDKGFAGVVRRAVYGFDPKLVVDNVHTVDEWIGGATHTARFALSILKVLSGMALATVGLFSVLAYTVDRRRGEFGVRLALGATPTHLTRLVLRRCFTLSALGIVAGMAGAAGLTRFLQSLLYATTPYDPAVYLIVAAVLLLASVAACWVPARRAARIDIARLLRAE